MISQCTKTIVAALVALFMGCTLFDGVPEWDISEPEEEEPNVEECPDFDGDWASDDFVMSLYFHIACERTQDDNFVFSPAAVRLALGERVREEGGDDGERLAELLGYETGQQMYESGEEYREELLDRRPIPYQLRVGSALDEHDIDVYFEEDDPERLGKALGIEFYGIQCEQSAVKNCSWSPHNDRWSDEEFFDRNPPREVGKPRHTAAFLLRGQWAANPSIWPQEPATNVLGFTDVDGNLIATRDLSSRGRYYAGSEDIYVFEWLLVGNEISVIFVGAPERTLRELETVFLSQSIDKWIAPVESASFYSDRRTLRIPAFDIEDTVELSEYFALENPLTITTRMNIFERDPSIPRSVINSAERVTTRWADDKAIPLPARGDVEHEPLVNFDSPFLFVVYDRPTESVLKIGRVSRP